MIPLIRRVGAVARRGALLLVLVAVAAVAPGALATAAPTGHADGATVAHAARACDGFRLHGLRFHVTVERGPVSCRTARRVLRRFLAGGGVKHGGPSSAETYWTLGRWKCGTGAGGGGCIRGGRTFRTARDWVIAQS